MLPYSWIISEKSIEAKALSLIKSFEGASFLHSFYRGSMAVEGSLVLTLFLFFMMTLLYSLEMVRFQSDLYTAMHQTGNKICFHSYQDKYGVEKSGIDVEMAAGDIRAQLEQEILPFLCVEGHEAGAAINAEYMGGDVEIRVSCRIKPFIWYLPVGDITIEEKYFGHGFVGYTGSGDAGEEEKEIFVYITPSGSRYHLTDSCKYLSFDIYAAAGEELEEKRNASGSRYYPCGLCRPEGKGLVYYTQWGEKYHGRSDCPSIKRTVSIVPLSEADGRTPCRSCG